MNVAAPVFAWNQPGHMMTASIAYDQTDARRNAPGSSRPWRPTRTSPSGQEMAPKDAPDFDFNRYVIDAWPRAGPTTSASARMTRPTNQATRTTIPKWHYVDFPLVPPDFPMQPPPTGTEDLFSGYTPSARRWSPIAADTSATDRAAYPLLAVPPDRRHHAAACTPSALVQCGPIRCRRATRAGNGYST